MDRGEPFVRALAAKDEAGLYDAVDAGRITWLRITCAGFRPCS